MCVKFSQAYRGQARSTSADLVPDQPRRSGTADGGGVSITSKPSSTALVGASRLGRSLFVCQKRHNVSLLAHKQRSSLSESSSATLLGGPRRSLTRRGILPTPKKYTSNKQFREARARTASLTHPKEVLSRQELAELVNNWIYKHHHTRVDFDRNYIGKIE